MVIVDKNGSLSYGQDNLVSTMMTLPSYLKITETQTEFIIGVIIEPGYVNAGNLKRVTVTYGKDWALEEIIKNLMTEPVIRKQLLDIYQSLGYFFHQAKLIR